MFGASSNSFGQSSNSPFGSPSVFGQANNANNNPFAPKPFGSTSPFGAQTGSSIFCGTSTGVFGAQASSPAFGVSSTPAFGATSSPAFGAASSPAFGASSSSFGGSSAFGQQKPAFGGFGSTTTSSPFGSSFQQSQPAFGSTTFGSTPFGAASQPAFGATSQPAFGSSSTPAFGATSTPAFGGTSTPAFGSTSTPTFGSTGSAFGVSNSSVFVFGSNTPAFGASSTPAFGTSSTPAFGSSSTPAFGSSPTSAFGQQSASAFNFGSSPAFGQQSASAFGSTPFGTAPTAFGAQSSPFGAQSTTPAFGSPGFRQTTFGSQSVGSRVTPYAQTHKTGGTRAAQGGGKLESISAMPAYKEKSHEELRWEDYQVGDKGGPNPAGQSSGGFNTNNTQQQQQPNLFSSPSAFGQPNASNPFSSSTATNPFAPKTSGFSTPTFGNPGSAPASSIFGAPQPNPNPFGSIPSPTQPSAFSTSTLGTSTSPIFGTSNTSAFGTSSLFNTTQAQWQSSPFSSGLNFGNTRSSPLFQSTTPSIAQTSSPFGQTPSAFGQAAPSFAQTTSAFGQSNAFGGNMFSSTPSLLNSSMGYLSQRVDRSKIKAGDHIYTWRIGFTYSHHGICVGGNKVIHFTPPENGSSDSARNFCSGLSASHSNLSASCLNSLGCEFPQSKSVENCNLASCLDQNLQGSCSLHVCGFHQPGSGVMLSCLNCFKRTGSLYLFQYGVSKCLYVSKLRGGTCTIAKSDPLEEVIQRAEYLLQHGFGSYDVVRNNCEDFALYCKTGLLIGNKAKATTGGSGQVNFMAAAINGSGKIIVASTVGKIVLSSIPVGAVTLSVGMHCWNRYKTDIGVRDDVVKVKVEDVGSFRETN